MTSGAATGTRPGFLDAEAKEITMSFTLPDLPYAYDALQPYMSRETLEYHHDKHHKENQLDHRA